MKYAILCALAIIACNSATAFGGREELKPLKGVSIKLELTANPYNPFAPDGDIVITLINRSKKTITGPITYDGKKLLIQAGGLVLRSRNVVPGLPPRIKPGGVAEIARLSMAEVFAGRQLRNGKRLNKRNYYWDWRRRPEPPDSPIHVWRPRKGANRFRPFAYLTARFRVGDREVVSNAALLIVDANVRPKALSGVVVHLKTKAKKYDPSAKGNARLLCTIVNQSKKTIHVPAEYHATECKLRAHTAPQFHSVLTLYKKRKKGVKSTTIAVKPGKSHTLLSVALDDILRVKQAGGLWSWDWQARPKAPLSPLLVRGRKGVDVISMYITVRINHTPMTSNLWNLPIVPKRGAK